MTVEEIVDELRTLGRDSIKKVLLNHGAVEPIFGVKVEDLKKIQKRIKRDHQLALDLYATGISDAMYLAGLIVDDQQMTKRDLKRWLKEATWSMISGCTVAWVTAESRHGRELAVEWINSKNETTAATGWATYSSLISITPDEKLDTDEICQLLQRIQDTIHRQPDRVRYDMNGFLISAGAYIASLTETAIQIAESIGQVAVDMGKTDCKVPNAADYIRKIQQRGTIGKKRKTAKC